MNNGRVLSVSGFSLVEILVAVGLLGVVSLGMASLFTTMSQQQRSTRATFAAQTVVTNLQTVFGSYEICGNTLGSGTAGVKAILKKEPQTYTSDFKDLEGSVIYPVGPKAAPVEDGLIRIRSWQLTPLSVLSSSPLTKMTRLTLELELLGTPSSTKVSRSFTILTTLDSSNKVTSCHAIGTAADGSGGGSGGGSVPTRADSAMLGNGMQASVCPAGKKLISCEGGETVKSKVSITSFSGTAGFTYDIPVYRYVSAESSAFGLDLLGRLQPQPKGPGSDRLGCIGPSLAKGETSEGSITAICEP